MEIIRERKRGTGMGRGREEAVMGAALHPHPRAGAPPHQRHVAPVNTEVRCQGVIAGQKWRLALGTASMAVRRRHHLQAGGEG